MRELKENAAARFQTPAPFAFSAEQVAALDDALVPVELVLEAHLPRAEPASEDVLAVVLRMGHGPDLARLAAAVPAPFDQLPVVWLRADDPRVPELRQADTRAFTAPAGSPAYQDLLVQHAGASLAKAFAFEHLVDEGNEPTLDIGKAVLRVRSPGFFLLAKKHAFPVCVVGREQNRLWRWGWAEPDRFPSQLTKESGTIKRFGELRDVAELCQPELSLAEHHAVALALVSCGVLGGSFFYAVPDAEGTTYVVSTAPFEGMDRALTADDVTVLVETLSSSWTLKSVRAAIEAFARARKLTLQARGPSLDLACADGSVSLRFDGRGRVRSTQSTFG
jgi:hypothetical protein